MTKTFFLTLKSDKEIVEVTMTFTPDRIFGLFNGAVKDGEVIRVIDSDTKKALITNYRTGDTKTTYLDETIEFEAYADEKAASFLASLETGNCDIANREQFDPAIKFIAIERAA